MNIFKQLVTIVESEKKDNRYEYGCAMVYFDFPEMQNLHSMITQDEIYAPEGGGYGLETEPHVTLLFGLHDEEIDDNHVMELCSQKRYENMSLQGISLFKNPEFEVLKFDVVCDDLHHVNSLLKQLPHTSRFPDYHPHATIAYLRPGTGDNIIKRIKAGKPYMITPKEIVYSKSNRDKIRKPL